MKIIAQDNLGRSRISDLLVAENVHPTYAAIMVEALNRASSEPEDDEKPDWVFIAVPDNYRMHDNYARLLDGLDAL